MATPNKRVMTRATPIPIPAFAPPERPGDDVSENVNSEDVVPGAVVVKGIGEYVDICADAETLKASCYSW